MCHEDVSLWYVIHVYQPSQCVVAAGAAAAEVDAAAAAADTGATCHSFV